MAARYERRRRIVPIPRTIPTIPAASPYGELLRTAFTDHADSQYFPVPLIRPPPGMPWSATLSNLPEIESFYRLINMPQRSAVLTTPYNSPRELPFLADENQPNYADRPVWPPQIYTATRGFPNRPALPHSGWWEPGTFPVQPFNTVVPLRLHPHIIVNPMNPSIPILQWDILHRAEQARIYTGRQVIVSADLGAQAVLPNVSKIYISSDRYPLAPWIESWGPIMVEKPKVTIRDILDAIYEYFQKPLTRREFRRINELPSNAVRLATSAQKRASAAHELYSVGVESGFRRVDVMGSHRRFQGLRLVVFQDNTWKLFLELLPLAGPVPLTS
jgi:hypothetical protein